MRECCTRIPPQSGRAFKLRRGEVLRITDPMGQQVADLYAFKDGDSTCSLSSGRSIDYASKFLLTTGDVLYSNTSERMFTIGQDTVGRHDFLLTPCSQEMFEILYQHKGHHPSCYENLYTAFAPHGIVPSQIGTTFNVFMNVQVHPDGRISVEPPTSKAGDFVELRAEMDMVCALTSCSAEQSNNGTFKPIDFEILTRPCGCELLEEDIGSSVQPRERGERASSRHAPHCACASEVAYVERDDAASASGAAVIA